MEMAETVGDDVRKKFEWKGWLLLITLIALALGAVFLLVENTSLKRQLREKSSGSNSAACIPQEVITQKDEELRLCIEDKSKMGSTGKKPYSFQDIGVYSPYFEDKEIEYTMYEYKRNTITNKSIVVEEKTGGSWGINVWELTSPSRFLPLLEGYAAFGTQYDFPVFEGYENYGTPIWISARMAGWRTQKSITNKNGVAMYLSYAYAPKSIASVQLEFYNPNSSSGHQAFVVLWYGVKDYLEAGEATHPSVVKARNELIKVADTISLRLK